ncbi:hypothetical protein EV672_104169 [Aquabacterium commune]|uniref:Uncharacterized protein n=1 Tax=Aquabacterium commune TaxID=70586 RepID=A0A4V3CVU3_9BURK|nr:hypothetical protein EV672_104169 [Aquabacterium commune]
MRLAVYNVKNLFDRPKATCVLTSRPYGIPYATENRSTQPGISYSPKTSLLKSTLVIKP